MNNYKVAACVVALGLCVTTFAEDDDSEEAWDVDNPPGEARSVSIDTRSGTWMSLDVSPDGQMWGFAQGGMSAIETLRTATTAAAWKLGFDKDLGSIEEGKLADMVIIDADVLADIYQSDKISMVMLNGRLYDAATLNETVTGNRRTRPFYWQK